VEAVVEGRIDARRELEEALDERDIAQGRFEAAIGTSAEMGAYQRLRRAARRVSVADRVARSKTSP
jgi:hypothetical protein